MDTGERFVRHGSADMPIVAVLLFLVAIVALDSLANSKAGRPDLKPQAQSPTYAKLKFANDLQTKLARDLIAASDARVESDALAPVTSAGDILLAAQPAATGANRWQDAPIIVPAPTPPTFAVGTAIRREDGSYAGWVGPSGALSPEAGESTSPRAGTQAYSGTYASSVAENGSYRGEISDVTGRPKTVHVRGYTRRDGTYVRGHYRSR